MKLLLFTVNLFSDFSFDLSNSFIDICQHYYHKHGVLLYIFNSSFIRSTNSTNLIYE